MNASGIHPAEAMPTSFLCEEQKSILSQLDEIPHSFVTIGWSHSKDFQYVGKGIEEVTGYPQDHFSINGQVFFFSITPPQRLKEIYADMTQQIESLKGQPGFLTLPHIIKTKGAVLTTLNQEVPIAFRCIILDMDYKLDGCFQMIGFFLDTLHCPDELLESYIYQAEDLLLQFKTSFHTAYSDRFALWEAGEQVTQRELDVARLLATGYSTKEIAESLNITFNTVESHRKNLLSKFQSKNTVELLCKMQKVFSI